MNTLNIIRKQIEKASALHDAQIYSHYISWCQAYECKQGKAKKVHGTFCYRGRIYTK